ncbi:Hsp70 family protein [Shewanella baltica]|uniref:Hsp70 family protein n=1 Tax=Shewanella baltica TaxID=62322 RepID=UPI003D7A63B6
MKKNYIGIDFGTSNCSVAAWVDGKVVLIPVDDDFNDKFKIRSSIFIREDDKSLPTPTAERITYFIGQIKNELTRNKVRAQEELDNLIGSAENNRGTNKVPSTYKNSNTYISLINTINNVDAQIENVNVLSSRAKRLAISEIYAQIKTASLDEMLTKGTIEFGEAGFQQYLSTPEAGKLVNSPKNFLGADIGKSHLQVFETVVGRLLSYLRLKAEAELDQPIHKAVIARPVHYHSTLGEAGNIQAISIMERAAAAAGFDEVQFIFEPMAAALHFEKQLEQERTVMIVDLGGGTSDVVICKLSPERVNQTDRQADILSVKGNRIGGIVCDKDFAMTSVSPYFGRGELLRGGAPIPHMIFNGMVDIDNFPLLNDFYLPKHRHEIERFMGLAKSANKLNRLLTLQKSKLVHRFMSDVEKAKINLSDCNRFNLSLDYIDENTAVPLKSIDMSKSMTTWLNELKHLIDDSITTANSSPELIYITGGMGLSPAVQTAIKDWFPSTEITIADPFNSVASGAAIHAHLAFGE